MKTVSVVILCIEKNFFLPSLLNTLQYQTYSNFEVVIVHHADVKIPQDVLSNYSSLKIIKVDNKNLAAAKNHALEVVSADFVTFLNSNALPENQWLKALLDAFDKPEIGCVGGYVFKDNTYSLAFAAARANRIQGVYNKLLLEDPLSSYYFPGCYRFPVIPCINACFRTDLLRELGGFNENIFEEYFEEEICSRIIDSGYLIKNSSRATLFDLTFSQRKIKTSQEFYDQIDFKIKKIFTFIKNNKLNFSNKKLIILKQLNKVALNLKKEAKILVERNIIKKRELKKIEERIFNQIKENLTFFDIPLPNFQKNTFKLHNSDFKPFHKRFCSKQRLVICLIESEYYENIMDSNLYQLSLKLAGEGHFVYLLISQSIEKVEFVDGIWIHSLIQENITSKEICPLNFNVSEKFDIDMSFFKRVSQINSYQQINIVHLKFNATQYLPFLKDDCFKRKIVLDIYSNQGKKLTLKPEAQPDVHRAQLEPFLFSEARNFLIHPHATVSSIKDEFGLVIPGEKYCQLLAETPILEMPPSTLSYHPTLKSKFIEDYFVQTLYRYYKLLEWNVEDIEIFKKYQNTETCEKV